jgi:hypothetical protein
MLNAKTRNAQRLTQTPFPDFQGLPVFRGHCHTGKKACYREIESFREQR